MPTFSPIQRGEHDLLPETPSLDFKETTKKLNFDDVREFIQEALSSNAQNGVE